MNFFLEFISRIAILIVLIQIQVHLWEALWECEYEWLIALWLVMVTVVQIIFIKTTMVTIWEGVFVVILALIITFFIYVNT